MALLADQFLQQWQATGLYVPGWVGNVLGDIATDLLQAFIAGADE